MKRINPLYVAFAGLCAAGFLAIGHSLFSSKTPQPPVTAETESAAAVPTASPSPGKSIKDLAMRFGGIPLIDAHNHDAGGMGYLRMAGKWKELSVDRIVLFGDVSEPSAVDTDQNAMTAYKMNPQMFIPFFSGFDLHDPSSLEVVKANLESGFFGLGEIAAASTNSPVLAKVKWKAQHPMDGYLPQIYDICSEYGAPVLLHIDPPGGMPIVQLEKALEAHPNTSFIFAHANAYNSPDNIRRLLEKHPNLYADFFAGFTSLNKDSANKLEDFIPVMKQFPDRFMLSTDSGFGLESEEAAIGAMYQVVDLLEDKELIRKIAHDNLFGLIARQRATETQIATLREKLPKDGPAVDWKNLTKWEAGQLLYGK
ncbi:amidohydrolase family protein [Paenibacillus hamazuiensis]|uniref:amidohydrolase family protein n=1 Tax=Paenibacillus hamazuiensis TaxID=2936508 RepID=UPI00200BF8BA|nr:amidohydrolase family protein [Paenibacillus hamazuiensis]